jgi:PPOX class probable F420-dependent enzyme
MRLDAGAARRRFGAAPVARLATVSPTGRPHLVPVTFALDSDGDQVYTAVDAKPKTTTQLQRLRNIQAHPRVALLADHYADDWTQLWWVRADGAAAVLDAAARAGPLRLLAARYPQYAAQPPAGPVIAIQVDRWTGWAAAAG